MKLHFSHTYMLYMDIKSQLQKWILITYRVDEGFMALSPLAPLADHSMGDSFLAPRRTTTCWAHQDFDPY